MKRLGSCFPLSEAVSIAAMENLSESLPPCKPKLLDRVRFALRLRHYNSRSLRSFSFVTPLSPKLCFAAAALSVGWVIHDHAHEAKLRRHLHYEAGAS